MSRLLIILFTTSVLFSCSDPNDVASICDSNNNLCQDLNEDKWCVAEKESLIWARYKINKVDTSSPLIAKKQYRLLHALNGYQECIKVVALIEPRKNPQLKSERVVAMISTYEELQNLEKLTSSSENPYLLYYHWQYKNNDEAKSKLIELSKANNFNSAELQFALANVYYDETNEKTILSLLRGISLVDKEDINLLTGMHYSLITAYMDEKKYKLAYLWSKAAKLQSIENISLAMFQNTDKVSRSERKIIDLLAQDFADKIQTNSFDDSEYNNYLSAVDFSD